MITRPDHRGAGEGGKGFAPRNDRRDSGHQAKYEPKYREAGTIKRGGEHRPATRLVTPPPPQPPERPQFEQPRPPQPTGGGEDQAQQGSRQKLGMRSRRGERGE